MLSIAADVVRCGHMCVGQASRLNLVEQVVMGIHQGANRAFATAIVQDHHSEGRNICSI